MENKIKYGVIHVHSENSRKDSVAKVEDLFARAKELGAPAITLTDHGVLTGVEEAKKAAKKIGIKYIPGVEAYYENTNSGLDQRMHLILLAKDEIGYRAISLAVTESNANLDSKGYPRMNEETLRKYFAEGSIGHNHVIATSACMTGVLSSVLLMNGSIEKEIKKIADKKATLYNPNSPVYKTACEKYENLTNEIEHLNEEIKRLDKLAKMPFTAKEKAVKASEGTPEYAEKKARLDAEKKASEDAATTVEEYKAKRVALKLEQKEANESKKLFEGNNMERYNEFERRIEALRAEIFSDEELYQRAIEQAKTFENIFGKGDFYCELQYHGIEAERDVMPLIAKIAMELNIPMVAANDAHMVLSSKDDVKARQLIRALRFNKWEELLDGDSELYIKSDEELADSLSQILPMEIVEKAFDGIREITEKCDVVFSNEPHYPKFESDVANEDAATRLRRLAYEGIEWRYPNGEGWTNEHKERMEYELGIITDLGFCDYLCIVEDFLSYGRLLGKINLDDPRYIADPYNVQLLKELANEEVGLGIGPGRGSAVGSLVCYLIGITGIDPMKYGLIFERFLNKERVSMPDIDSDFKTDIRNRVLDYVKYKYGPDAVCCIMTRGTQAAKASIRNTARLLGSEKYGDTKRFLALGDQIAKAIPNVLNIKLSDCEDKITEQFGNNDDAMEIFHNAKLIEGSFVTVGMHAAGVIISDNGDVKQYVPLMYNTDKEQWMTQCEKDPCEALGLLKMDFLGLRNLNIITETLREIKKNTGKSIDIELVPFEKEVFSKIFAAGNTNSVFQFESGGMKKMLRQFRPESIEDIILLVAAYRPGPMQYLDSIIAVKHGRKKPEYVIPEMETILGKTYGYPVYQEQIMQIFNKFAGFSLGESDIIRRLMSKKKTKEFAKYKDKFIDGLCENGADRRKAEDFWTQMVDFSEYAFNKSHAAAYAFVAYYTAWLKCFYPTEYLCAVMNDTVFEKLGGLIADCRSFGVQVNPANINVSDAKFSTCKDGVVVGLGLIKGVASSASPIIIERANGKFKSFTEFMLRTRTSKDVAENLIYAGAFDEFTRNRQALVDAVPEYCEILKKIKIKENILEAESTATTEKEIEKENAKKERAQEAINTLISNMNSISVNLYGEENLLVRLENEKEKIGAFISGHPLDTYGTPSDYKCTEINDLERQRNVSIMGIITDLRVVQRKSDNADLAFFNLEDQTGTIAVNCFTNTYAQFKDMIQSDGIVIITGDCIEDTDNITDETVLKINAKSFKTIKAKKKTVVIEIESGMDWVDRVENMVKPFRAKDGMNLVAFDKMYGQFRNIDAQVSADIMSLTELNPRIV